MESGAVSDARARLMIEGGRFDLAGATRGWADRKPDGAMEEVSASNERSARFGRPGSTAGSENAGAALSDGLKE